MDVAYDQIAQEESLSADEQTSRQSASQEPITLNTEFQQAFQAVSASPWGARLGGFFGQVKKQSETLYSDAQKEYAERSEQASRGITGLIAHTRNLSFEPPTSNTAVSFSDPTFTLPEPEQSPKGKEKEAIEEDPASTPSENPSRPESLPADIYKEATTQATSLVTRLRTSTPTFLTRIQKAEDAADEALLKFGSGLKNFLREAVTVTGPDGGAPAATKEGETAEVLFETNDAEGKKVFHASRFDAQLHVIHTTPASFIHDPESGEYEVFAKEFDIDKSTEAIAKDLDKYEELRRAMEKLVPEKVEYKTFWTRYYFLRKVIEEEETRRREVLKGAAAEPEEELGWGSDDSDNENEDESTTPNAGRSATTLAATPKSAPAAATKDSDLLRPASPRRSEEDGKSTADSDASYDIVSGATSRALGSPKEEKRDPATAAVEPLKEVKKEEESDEEDWE